MKKRTLLHPMMLVLILCFSAGAAATDKDFVIYGETTALVGLCQAEKAQQFVRNPDWETVTIPNTTQTVCILYIQQVKDSSVGRYTETVNTFLVKRKDAPPLPLKTPGDLTDPVQAMDYLQAALYTLGVATYPDQVAGLPHQYGFYNHHLLLDNPDAIQAGKTQWGYPKQQALLSYKAPAKQAMRALQVWEPVRQSGRLHHKEMVLQVWFDLREAVAMPLESTGDNILPSSPWTPDGKLAQLSGTLSTQGENGLVAPFQGELTVGRSFTETAVALRTTGFNPKMVLLFQDLKGTARPLYDKPHSI
ncbi:acetoacetate decarboxylase family protein [Photobacterium sp. TY1-4]|uniref:acetoacetate decarboxylase family protein n=1 Tax=Photobacterium sp. TY1-4 TaxID=2899122 RepID=UPI0021C07EA0|nr:acetoacetate decarboxylase family protein [Photobacterium sp. TY1-4]UXI03409.1 acetoacetate decarboxylase family protein [Photobacterium sp. TY1-4]